MDAGELQAAETMFRDLLARTGSPRIKLELARTLFLQKKYREARALFDEVLLDPELPWRVRDNVEAFIGAIDRARGYAKFSLSFVTDSNPRNITAQRDFAIGGFRLTFQAPEDNRKVSGLRYAVQAHQPLLPESQLSAYLTASYLDFPGHSLDRLTFNIGALKGLDAAGRTSVSAGVEAGTFGEKRLYDFPYVSAQHELSQSASHRITGELKVGYVRFPDYSYLNAVYKSAGVTGLRSLTSTFGVSATAALEHATAYDEPYSYTGVAAGPGITWLITQPALLVKADVGLSTRRYAAVDPLFGEQRVDRKTRLDLSLRSKEWRWFSWRPALILSVENNRSNIGFYEYRKVSASVALE